MPAIHVDASTPYPIDGWLSVSFAKNTSATLSVAANRTIPPIATKTSNRSRSCAT